MAGGRYYCDTAEVFTLMGSALPQPLATLAPINLYLSDGGLLVGGDVKVLLRNILTGLDASLKERF